MPAGTHDALVLDEMMNTTGLLNESRGAARRSSFVMPHGLTDHDPVAHRHAVEIDATIRVSGRELRVQNCRLRSLSLGGALLEFDRLPIGTLTNITFGLPDVDERLSLDAVVDSCTREGVNVLFDSPRAWEVWVLWRYLVSLDDDVELDPTCTLSIDQPVPAQDDQDDQDDQDQQDAQDAQDRQDQQDEIEAPLPSAPWRP